MTKDMTAGKPLGLILRFCGPMVFGNILQQLYSMVDTVIVGRYLGASALAGVGATGAISFLVVGFATGICTGLSIPVAQAFGAGDYHSMRKNIANSYYLGALIGVLLTILTMIGTGTILHWMKTPDDIYQYSYDYIIVIFGGILTSVLYNSLAAILRAVGDSKSPILFLAVSSVLNIILDLVFLVGMQSGVAGAGYATVISQGISGILCLIYLYKKFHIMRFQHGECKPELKRCGRLLSIGLPMALQFSITAIGSIMLQSANNALGTSCVAAFTAGMRIKMFFMCPLESMGIAMATYCGQNYGAGKTERINMGLRASFFMVCLYCIFCFIVLHIFARHIIYLFVDFHEYEIIEKANQFIVTSCTYFIPLGLLCLLRYSIQGLGYSKLAMMSGVFEMVDRTAVSLFLVPILGYTGVCYGDPSAWFAADLFLIPAYLYVHKRLSRKRCYAQAS